MPRYFFHIRDGEFMPDEVGTELNDDHAARVQAVRACAEAIRDLGERFWNGEDWHMSVVDDTGREICKLDFSGWKA